MSVFCFQVALISENFGEIKPVARKLSASGLKPAVNVEDKEFLAKLATIEALTQKLDGSVAASQAAPSVVVFRMSLAGLRNAHQDTPTANAEASDLLAQQLGQFVDAAQKHYGDNALVAVVANEEKFSRTRRDTAAAPAASGAQARQDTVSRKRKSHLNKVGY